VLLRQLYVDLENERTYLDLIARTEHVFLIEQLAVDQGAIPASEVAKDRLVLRHAQKAVLATHPVAVEADVALRSSAEIILSQSEEQMFARRPTLNHKEANVHGISPA